MTGAQLREAQRAMQMSNAQLCKRLGVAETTLCGWKSDRRPMPMTAQLAVRYLLEKHRA